VYSAMAQLHCGVEWGIYECLVKIEGPGKMQKACFDPALKG